MAVAITEQCPARLSSLQPLWHRTAPHGVAETCPPDDPFGGWPQWRKHLATRRRPEVPPFFSGKQPPLLWGWPDSWQHEVLPANLKSPTTLVEIVLNVRGASGPDLSLALQMVALAYALPQLAGELPAEAWWQCVEQLNDVTNEAQQHRVDWPADPSDVVRQQLLAGELPLAMGYLFPEVRALRALRKSARVALSEALVELTDGGGLPHARLLPMLGPLFACWTRARWLGERLARGPWSPKAEVQYQWLVRHAIRLAEKGGRYVLTPRNMSSSASTKVWFRMALELVGDGGDYAAAAAAMSRRVIPKRARSDEDDLPDPSLNSDWSGITVMASGWSSSDVRLALAYADDPLSIDLSASGQRLLAGKWTSETTCDGELVTAVGEWEQLCWESGKRYDFLELGCKLSHDLRLERQLLLARDDHVLYLADIVTSSRDVSRELKHTIHVPLDDNAAWQPEAETRDGLIVAGKTHAAVLPLALKEWRADPRGGSLIEANGCLTLTQEAHGRALCCPLFFDLQRKRATKERTWRQLTVAESLEVLPRDVAVGFRAQSGRDQWLFYRSLGPAGNRTVLGQNIAGEFSAGRFLENGKYKEWIEIEAC